MLGGEVIEVESHAVRGLENLIELLLQLFLGLTLQKVLVVVICESES